MALLMGQQSGSGKQGSVGSRPRYSLVVGSMVLALSSIGLAGQGTVPMTPGVVLVLAVDNENSAKTAAARDIAQGDYEVVVAVTSVAKGEIGLSASFDALDADGKPRQGRVTRTVLSRDLQAAQSQILGFHTADNPVLDGTTALGPSRALVAQLLATNAMPFAFRNFANQPLVSGVLSRSLSRSQPFEVLFNGVRTELPALYAAGYMTAGKGKRPVELVIMDHPLQPILLRLSWGPVDGTFPFKAEFVREVVRINDAAANPRPQDAAVKTDCRAEIPGIYFDFNQATLRPESRDALQHIATIILAHEEWRFGIEGHTDGIGSTAYNDDLSARRVAAVKKALVRDFAIDDSRLWVKGIGERRPIASNETLAGRARNRRVELVRDCDGRNQ